MRRGVYAAVPWFALVLVSGVLFLQLRSRRPALQRTGRPSDQFVFASPEEQRHQLELWAAKSERTVAETETVQAELALLETRELRNRTEATRAAAEARASALQAELDALK